MVSQALNRGMVRFGISQQGDGPTTSSTLVAFVSFFFFAHFACDCVQIFPVFSFQLHVYLSWFACLVAVP